MATNVGSSFKALQKVASGGELSRISLAIAVICAQKSEVPTMIFDEIDVGISGATSERVGLLLKRLAAHTQVLCITHQAQVASLAQQHWLVEKSTKQKQTVSSIRPLQFKERVQETARMLAGLDITEQKYMLCYYKIKKAKKSRECGFFSQRLNGLQQRSS